VNKRRSFQREKKKKGEELRFPKNGAKAYPQIKYVENQWAATPQWKVGIPQTSQTGCKEEGEKARAYCAVGGWKSAVAVTPLNVVHPDQEEEKVTVEYITQITGAGKDL